MNVSRTESAVVNARHKRAVSVESVTKQYGAGRKVLDGVNLKVHEGERIGILGRNGSGKSTLIKIIGGAARPTEGRVIRGLSTSFPLGFGGTFQGSLTGLDNLRFICRVYGVSLDSVRTRVESFAELGSYFKEPVKTYSAGMRARLGFAISLAVDFECVLIDEIISVGDERFRERCREALLDKTKHRALVLVSHDENTVRAYCDRAAVLVDGRMTEFSDMEEAFAFYRRSIFL